MNFKLESKRDVLPKGVVFYLLVTTYFHGSVFRGGAKNNCLPGSVRPAMRQAHAQTIRTNRLFKFRGALHPNNGTWLAVVILVCCFFGSQGV